MIRRLSITLALVAGILAPAASSSADTMPLAGSEFSAGYIITDQIFYNSTTMSAPGIQAFLASMEPNCTSSTPACMQNYATATPTIPADTTAGLCTGYRGSTSETAATIISKVSVSCGVNPQSLLALIQKESGLVTANSPSQSQYNSATGASCPDTAPCNPAQQGFFNQVYGAARQFKLYRAYPYNYNYVAGRPSNIQYSPNSACGSSTVLIQNQATAGLYNYTPYQPNAAALANLYGSGDACSSYGNRNFWVLFNRWFGSTGTTATMLGHLDTVTIANDGTITASGWAMDPASPSQLVTIDLTLGSTTISTTTGQPRQDVANYFGTSSYLFGFSQHIVAPIGTSTVCAFANSLDGKRRVSIGCGSATHAAPTGHLDSVTRQPDGSYLASGWAMDPNAVSGSTIVRLTIGSTTTSVRADIARPGIAAHFGTGTDDQFGFLIPLHLSPGAQGICAWTTDAHGLGSTWLGCLTVLVPSPQVNQPWGALDSAAMTDSGSAIVRGWAIDPDAANTSIQVRIDLDGTPVATVTANDPRPDVQRSLRAPIADYGYHATIPVSPGAHTVCANGLDVQTGQPAQLRCTTLVAPPPSGSDSSAPIGSLDSAIGDGVGHILVAGWSMDRDFPGLSILVRIDLDGTPVATVASRDPRPDVERIFGTSYALYGYHATIAASDGAHNVCTNGIDAVTGGATQLRCAAVDSQPEVPRNMRTPWGSLDSATPTGSGNVTLRGWAIDPDYPGASTLVRIDEDGAQVAVVAARAPRPDVQAVLGTSSALYGYQTTISSSLGTHVICTYALDVFTGNPSRLRCTTVIVT